MKSVPVVYEYAAGRRNVFIGSGVLPCGAKPDIDPETNQLIEESKR